MALTIKYRGEIIRLEHGFALPYRWCGTLCFASLEDAKSAIDSLIG